MFQLQTSSHFGNMLMIFNHQSQDVILGIIRQLATTDTCWKCMQLNLPWRPPPVCPLPAGGADLVLLEKVFGNIYIDKIRAICLLEANYYWLGKLVFAKQMMDKTFQGDIIPVEQLAKRGSHATEGILTSGLFFDIARALYKTAAIESVDLVNCYDAITHPIPCIALQSFKVHKVMVAMILYVLKTMPCYLKTAFGQSAISFGSTCWYPLMGFSQGNRVAPLGFLAVFTLMINIYPNLTHGGIFHWCLGTGSLHFVCCSVHG